MPQMAPMLWLLYSLAFVASLMILSSFMYLLTPAINYPPRASSALLSKNWKW